MSIVEKESKVIKFEEMLGWLEGTYRVTTIVPYVNGPKYNVHIWTQDEFNEFLDAYGDFAEFIVDVTRIDNIIEQ